MKVAAIGFLIMGSSFEILCDCCLDLMMLFLNTSDIAIIIVKGVDYRCIIHDISRSEAIESTNILAI